MAIIGKIRKHSGLAIIVVGIAMIGFLFMSDQKMGCSQNAQQTDVGSVNGVNISYRDFNAKVEKNIEMQKANTGNDKITDQETYQIRQSTWTTAVREMIMGKEYEELGLTVSSDELFDQIQGKQPHPYILQYFKDPQTGQYNPALVLNYLKNLDKMEPKARDQWFQFEKAIKDNRQETKYNNLFTKAYYMPKAFLKKEYVNQARTLKVLTIAPDLILISDSAVKLTDADYEKYYERFKDQYFYQDQASRTIDYVIFEVTPSEIDRTKTAERVMRLFTDFQTSPDPLVYAINNSDADYKTDTVFVSKGKLPPHLDTLLFKAKPGDVFPPTEVNNAWYMAKLVDRQARPDSMKGSQILLTYAGLGNDNVKRTKEEARAKIDSLFNALKKAPQNFAEAARKFSDYPSAKEDGGDLKWFPDGNPNFEPFFEAGLELKPNEMKVVDTRIGFSLFMLVEKSAPVEKIRAAVLTQAIAPSNQTYQDTYAKASAFAGQQKTPEAFEQSAKKLGMQVRQSPNIKEMDSYVMGLASAREMVRWAFAEKTKVGDVSPVFDLTGQYAVAVLKSVSEKGYQPLANLKPMLESTVRNMKKVEVMAEKIKGQMAGVADMPSLAAKMGVKLDTFMVSFSGFNNRSKFNREYEVLGQLFNLKKGQIHGPLAGNYAAFVVWIDDIAEPPAKEDFAFEKMQLMQNFNQRVSGSLYGALEKNAEITDQRIFFY